METDISMAVATQPKTLDQKIAAAKSECEALWALTKQAQDAMRPYEEKMEAVRSQWADAHRRVEMLEAMKKEMAQ